MDEKLLGALGSAVFLGFVIHRAWGLRPVSLPEEGGTLKASRVSQGPRDASGFASTGIKASGGELVLGPRKAVVRAGLFGDHPVPWSRVERVIVGPGAMARPVTLLEKGGGASWSVWLRLPQVKAAVGYLDGLGVKVEGDLS